MLTLCRAPTRLSAFSRDQLTGRGLLLSASGPGENSKPETLGKSSQATRLQVGRDLGLSAAEAERGRSMSGGDCD